MEWMKRESFRERGGGLHCIACLHLSHPVVLSHPSLVSHSVVLSRPCSNWPTSWCTQYESTCAPRSAGESRERSQLSALTSPPPPPPPPPWQVAGPEGSAHAWMLCRRRRRLMMKMMLRRRECGRKSPCIRCDCCRRQRGSCVPRLGRRKRLSVSLQSMRCRAFMVLPGSAPGTRPSISTGGRPSTIR